MTEEEMRSLNVGDLVQHRAMSNILGRHSAQTYVVTDNYGSRVTAVCTVDITNAIEWNLVSKARREEP